MPKWTVQEQQKLQKLILAGEALETIASIMGRSPEAILIKAKRLGLAAPKTVKASSFHRKRRG